MTEAKLADTNEVSPVTADELHPAAAATMFEALLTDRLRVLGPDHPDTLTARNNLAQWPVSGRKPASSETGPETS